MFKVINLIKPITTGILLLLSTSVFAQKQFDMEIGMGRWNVNDPHRYSMAKIESLMNRHSMDIGQIGVSPLSVAYHIDQYQLQVTRHEIYGRHKRTELAFGLSVRMSFRDRHIATGNVQHVDERTVSEQPDYVHIRKTDKTWLNLYDRYNAVGLGPRVVGRLHINQRFSVSSSLLIETGHPFKSEFLNLITSVHRTETTTNETVTVSEQKDFETILIDKPNQWHGAIEGHSAVAYKLTENHKMFLELGVGYGGRTFFGYNAGMRQFYFGPSIGFRAYL